MENGESEDKQGDNGKISSVDHGLLTKIAQQGGELEEMYESETSKNEAFDTQQEANKRGFYFMQAQKPANCQMFAHTNWH